MSSTPSIYPEAFERARPNLAFSRLTNRITLLRSLTTDLSSYFHERALIEEAYIKSLSKLSARLQTTSGSSAVMTNVDSMGMDKREEDQQLGAWKDVRKTLVGEVEELIKVHEAWRRKVTEDVELPLKSSVGKQSWVRWFQNEATLGATVKDYEATLEKVQKAQAKSTGKANKSTTSKLLTSQSHLSNLTSSLSSSLPSFLSSSQSLDASHSTFLKEALIRYGTISSDLGRENMEMGERALVSVLAVDEGAEMQSWALRESMRAGATSANGGGGGRDRSGTDATASTGEGDGGNEFGSRPPVPRQSSLLAATSEGSERARTSSFTRSLAPPPPIVSIPVPAPSPAKSSSGGGFKLSSLIKRDRSSSIPNNNGGGGAKYGNLNLSDSPALPTSGSIEPRGSFESRDSEQVPEDAFGRGGGGSGMQAPIRPDNKSVASFGSSGGKKRESLMPFGGSSGSIFRRPSKVGGSPSTSFAPLGESGSGSGLVDEEGFSVKPEGYDKEPWAASSAGANLMDDEDEEMSNSLPASNFKLPAVAIASATITESESERQAALEKVKSTLLGSSSSSNLSTSSGGGLARRATRGRRDVRMTTYNPSSSIPIPDDIPLGKIMEQRGSGSEPFSASPSTSSFHNLPYPERSNSIMSSVSSQQGGLARVDPFEGNTEVGLKASVTEIVNVLIKGGEVTRVMIQGEIALSYRRPNSSSSSTPLRIRIANFEQLEKAAPNSAYISPAPDGIAGEYIVTPSLSTSTTTVLKYQLHVPEGEETSYVPLIVKASWKCEPGVTKVIVVYSSPASAKLAKVEASPFGDDEGQHESGLENVSFNIPISVPVTSQQSRPAATWSAEKSNLSFVLPNHVSFGTGEEKLLASLNTEGGNAAVPQPVVVRWKVEGRNVGIVGVELVGEENGAVVQEIRRSTVSGKYLVAP